jgi:hypothetical protein
MMCILNICQKNHMVKEQINVDNNNNNNNNSVQEPTAKWPVT